MKQDYKFPINALNFQLKHYHDHGNSDEKLISSHKLLAQFQINRSFSVNYFHIQSLFSVATCYFGGRLLPDCFIIYLQLTHSIIIFFVLFLLHDDRSLIDIKTCVIFLFRVKIFIDLYSFFIFIYVECLRFVLNNSLRLIKHH